MQQKYEAEQRLLRDQTIQEDKQFIKRLKPRFKAAKDSGPAVSNLLLDNVKAQANKDLIKEWGNIAEEAQGRKPRRDRQDKRLELDLKRPLSLIGTAPRRANSFKGEGILHTKSENMVYIELFIPSLVQETHAKGVL